MADYIEREAVMDELAERLVAKMPSTFANGIWAAHNTVRDLPAADVVPVVRCKDCKHRAETFKPEVEKGGGICMKMYDTGRIEGYLCRVKPDDFCSRGKRRDGDGNGND